MKLDERSRLILVVLVVAFGFTVPRGLFRNQDNGPDRDIVFLLETEKVKVHAVHVLRVRRGETLDDPKVLEGLNVLLKRVQMGRKPLNHPATIGRFPIRLESDNGQYYVHLQYLRVKDELTIELRAGGVGDDNPNHANIYYLDGMDAIEWSKVVPAE